MTPRPSSRRPPGLVQIGVMPLGHEAAIPRQQRRLGHQRIIQQVNQRLMPDQIARRIAQHGRRITGQPRRDGRALRQPRPDRGQIARPPRSSASRDSARSMSGTRASAPRRSASNRASPASAATASWRAAISPDRATAR